MPAKFRVTSPGGEPFESEVNNTATIGRTGDNTIRLQGNHVSRQHAIVRCHNGYQYQIMDLGSRNGTFVNDQRVVMPITLEPGAKVRIANYELVFDQTPDDDPQTMSMRPSPRQVWKAIKLSSRSQFSFAISEGLVRCPKNWANGSLHKYWELVSRRRQRSAVGGRNYR